ncbi:uncharacterized protein LOC130998302 [Salvia miltiorrhiza]|uniref:uncharacterized protein LOC130998302 n=1 Tax=Salvia miltiorrhiza TaxID=226208 RepID=UPI0025ACC93E|nr:uncharacterized protein LOC130998302 [Salvia miltiorrhiza]
MNALSWNCRGLGQPLAVPTILELNRVHRPSVIFLCETLSHRTRLEEIKNRLNFDGCFSVDSLGRSGGLCMMWKNSYNCSILGYSRNHIDLCITNANGNWRLTGYYGFPERSRRRDSWTLLRRLAGVNNLSWLIIGDFNDLLDPGDKRGRVDHPNWLFTGFRVAVLDCGLSDIPLHGYPFTWSGGLGSDNFVEERLDRGMATQTWRNLFPNAMVSSLLAPISDHAPIILKCNGMPSPLSPRRFRFENKWCLEPEFPNIVRDCWTNLSGIHITDRLMAVSDAITVWASHLRSNERATKARIQQRIAALQGRRDSISMRQLQGARKELSDLLLREESHWKQRAK